MGKKRTKTSKYLLKAQLFSGDAENIRKHCVHLEYFQLPKV